MKHITVKHSAFIVVVIVLVVVLGLVRKNESVEPQIETTTSTVPSSATKNSQTSVTQSTKTTTAVKPAVKTSTQGQSYASYADTSTQLAANQSACKSAAAAQFKQSLVATYEGASYLSYYNSVNGLCYLQSSGIEHPAYSSTKIGHIYFRNVSRATLIADCTDPTGTMLSDSAWSCTNRQTGESLNKAQFNALVLADATH